MRWICYVELRQNNGGTSLKWIFRFCTFLTVRQFIMAAKLQAKTVPDSCLYMLFTRLTQGFCFCLFNFFVIKEDKAKQRIAIAILRRTDMCCKDLTFQSRHRFGFLLKLRKKNNNWGTQKSETFFSKRRNGSCCCWVRHVGKYEPRWNGGLSSDVQLSTSWSFVKSFSIFNVLINSSRGKWSGRLFQIVVHWHFNQRRLNGCLPPVLRQQRRKDFALFWQIFTL